MMGDTFCSPLEEELGNYIHRGRLLGSNTSLFGPALIAGEYKLYFLVDSCVYLSLFPYSHQICVDSHWIKPKNSSLLSTFLFYPTQHRLSLATRPWDVKA
jgi:hypothetical protein